MKLKAFLTKANLRKAIVVLVILALFSLWGYRILDITRVYRSRNGLENDIEGALVDAKFSGVVLLAKGEEVKYIHAFGQACEGRDFTENIIVPVFSITKQFTAYAILLLEQEGKLSRTDKLSKYFDDCKYGDEVTIADLLSMTSGIPEYVQNEDIFADPENRDSYLSEVDADWLLKGILNLELENKGEYNYSNSNYYLLGVIIERVSGVSYEDYIKHYVTGPAGIAHIHFDPQNAESDGLYISETDGSNQFGEEYNKSITFAAGSICTSIPNLYRWQKYLYSDKSAVDIKKAFGDQEYGYNFGLSRRGTSFDHSGGGLFHRHWMYYDTADDTQVIVLSNSTYTDAKEIAIGLMEMEFGKKIGE